MLRCTICKSQIDNGEHKPVCLCKHIICLYCINKAASIEKAQIFCILCNRMVKFDPIFVEVNEQVLEVIQTLNPKAEKPRFFCSAHPDQNIQFYCAKEKEYFCSNCVLGHANHHQDVKLIKQEEICQKANQLIQQNE